MRLGSQHSPETRAKMRAARLGKTLSPETRAKVAAAKIGDKNPMWGLTHTTEAQAKMAAAGRGDRNARWAGGRRFTNGYALVYRPGHPMADARSYVYEHRLVMSELIGRMLLPEETVHHVNEVPSDNAAGNLWLFPNKASHAAWHAMVRRGSELAAPMAAVAL